MPAVLDPSITKPSADPFQLSYLGNQANKEESTGYLQSLQRMLGSTAGTEIKAGQRTTQAGTDLLGDVTSYFKNLLTGGQAAEEALQPDIDKIGEQFTSIRGMLSDTAPRGGGKASALAQLPTEQIKTVANMKAAARSGAGEKLASTAGQMAGIGLNRTGTGVGAAGSAASSVASEMFGEQDLRLKQKEQKNQMLGMIGKGLGSLLGMVVGGGGISGLLGGILGGGSSGDIFGPRDPSTGE